MDANQPAATPERTVLVVDDSRFVRTTLKYIIGDAVAVRSERRALPVLCVRILSYDEVEYRIGRGVADALLSRIELALAQFSAAPVARVAPATFALLAVAANPAEMAASLRGVQERLA